MPEYIRQQMGPAEIKVMRKALQKEMASTPMGPKELTKWTTKYTDAFHREKKKKFDAAARKPVVVQAGDVTSLLKRKPKRGRGATIKGPGTTDRPSLLNLLFTRRKSLLGE